jgi:hypothetical protein
MDFNDRRPEEYRGEHQPPSDSAPLHDLANQEIGTFPPDVYDTLHYYGHNPQPRSMEKESMRAIHAARGNPESSVRIYRAVPQGVKTMNPGDWVSLSRSYAHQHGRRYEGGYDILSRDVPAREVRSGLNDILEWGWWPR